MPERPSHQRRVKELLAQDPNINDTHTKEFRMQLDQALESSEARAKQTRRRILIALAAYFIGMGICTLLASSWHNAAPNSTAGLIRGIIYFPFLISMFAGMVFGVWMIAIYVFKHGPQLHRARFDLQTSILLELQNQVKRLSENIERREK
jgi:uncharacterized membrane protein